MTLQGDDKRAIWLREQGFQVSAYSTEWTFQRTELPPLPAAVHLVSVGLDPHRQQTLRETLNAARQEADLPPFTPEAFTRDFLNLGLYRPELLWLAQSAAGETVGCACLHVWEGGHGELTWVSVRPAWRKQGIGTTLLVHASRASGLPHISANLANNSRHLSLLLKHANFQQSGQWLRAELELR